MVAGLEGQYEYCMQTQQRCPDGTAGRAESAPWTLRQYAEFSQGHSHAESESSNAARRQTTHGQIRDPGSGLLRRFTEAAISDTKSTPPLRSAGRIMPLICEFDNGDRTR